MRIRGDAGKGSVRVAQALGAPRRAAGSKPEQFDLNSAVPRPSVPGV